MMSLVLPQLPPSNESSMTRAAEEKIPPLKKKKITNKTLYVFKHFEIFKFQFFHVTPSNFPHLIVKTASPGPVVSVPTPGSCESHDLTLRSVSSLWSTYYLVVVLLSSTTT